MSPDSSRIPGRSHFIARLTNTGKLRKFYQKAFSQAISATSTKRAPWNIIPADRKYVVRALVVDIVAAARAKLEKNGDGDRTATVA